MANEEKDIQQAGGRALYGLETYIPEGLTAHFSSGFHVVSTDQEVYLSFLQPEIPLTNPDGKVQTIRNKCVARIILTPKGLDVLIDMLTRNRDRKNPTEKPESE